MVQKKGPPTLPGQILLKGYLEPLGVTQMELARHLGWTWPRMNEIVNGRRVVTADSALALGEAFGTGPELWLDLQRDWDLWQAMQKRTPVKMLSKAKAALRISTDGSS